MSQDKPRGIDEVTRRSLIGILGTGAASALAGCNEADTNGDETTTTGGNGGNGGTTSKQTGPLPHVEGQSLIIPWDGSPEGISFINTGYFPLAEKGGESIVGPSKPWDVGMEFGMWGPWANREAKYGEPDYLTYEDVSVAPDELTVTIRSDAKWSNGDDVLAKDFLGQTLAFRLFPNLQSFDTAAEEGVSLPTEAITDYEYSDKELTLISDFDGFGEILTQDIYARILTGWMASMWGLHPTPRVDPYPEWKSRIEDYFDQTVAGEADPWNTEEDSILNGGGDIFEVWRNDEGMVKDKLWEKFRAPENIAMNGAFTVSNIRGDQSIVFEKNEEYYGADKVNFDEVVLEVHAETRANWASLKANHLDQYMGNVPNNVVKSFPDDVTQKFAKSGAGTALMLNFANPLFEHRDARRALLYATDSERIARTIHPDREIAVTTPGAHTWGIDRYIDSSLTDKLESFEPDIEKAQGLMENAGFTLEGGSWQTPDGEQVTLTLPTMDKTPTFEVAFGSQLQDFGIETSVQKMESSAFADDRDSGNLPVFGTDMGVGWTASGLGRMYSDLTTTGVRHNWHNIFPQEQIEQTDYQDDDEHGPNMGLITPATPEAFSAFTVEAPPVGEPDGDLKEWEVGRLSYAAWVAKDSEQLRENIQKLTWIYNYHLPILPFTQRQNQMFFDAGHWHWPADDAEIWDWTGVGWTSPHQIAAAGRVQANPDNPEEGASVQE